MGFNRRCITNETVISIFKQYGISGIIDWYTINVDGLVLESGLASEINHILSDKDFRPFGDYSAEDTINKRISLELNLDKI